MTLEEELLAVFRSGVERPLAGERFTDLALRVFAHQFERNRPYRAFCEARGRTPATVQRWWEIPAVPTAAFKELPLTTFPPEEAAAVFETSGTTAGGRPRGPAPVAGAARQGTPPPPASRPGRHYMRTTALYDAALLPPFGAALLPDGARLPMLSLGPSPRFSPHSSLGHMLGRVMAAFGGPGSAELVTESGIDHEGLAGALSAASAAGQPVCLLGTAFAFVHVLETLAPRRFALPAGSRLMDTGGYKGRSRAVPRDELLAAYEETFGIPPDCVVSEYGMTEMSSQFYDMVRGARCPEHRAARRVAREMVRGAIEAAAGRPTDRHTSAFTAHRAPRTAHHLYAGPPWVRTVVVDPESLELLPRGATGLLRHYDLANLDSVMAIQTDDLGIAHAEGFELLGRAAGAEARGCSLAVEELLQLQ
jgi:hypothetical protein